MVSKVLLVFLAVLVLSQAVLSLNPHYFDEGKIAVIYILIIGVRNIK